MLAIFCPAEVSLLWIRSFFGNIVFSRGIFVGDIQFFFNILFSAGIFVGDSEGIFW